MLTGVKVLMTGVGTLPGVMQSAQLTLPSEFSGNNQSMGTTWTSGPDGWAAGCNHYRQNQIPTYPCYWFIRVSQLSNIFKTLANALSELLLQH